MHNAFFAPASYQAIAPDCAARAASVSNTRINALSVTPVRRKAPGPCLSVPVAQNRISGGVAQKLLYALQHLCQCHSAGSSKHSSQHRYR